MKQPHYYIERSKSRQIADGRPIPYNSTSLLIVRLDLRVGVSGNAMISRGKQ